MTLPMPGEHITHAGRDWEVIEIGTSSDDGLHLVVRDAENPRGPRHVIPVYGRGNRRCHDAWSSARTAPASGSETVSQAQQYTVTFPQVNTVPAAYQQVTDPPETDF